MTDRLLGAWRRLNLGQRFLLGTLLIMLAGTFGVSSWVGQQIEAGVVRQSGATAALLLDSFVSPQLQDYAKTGQLEAQHAQALANILAGSPVGKWVAAFTVWDMNGREVYSS